MLSIVKEEEFKIKGGSPTFNTEDFNIQSPHGSNISSSSVEDTHERVEIIQKFNLAKYLEGELEKLLKVELILLEKNK